MTENDAIKVIKDILNECTESEEAVCYVTGVDAPALEMAINALNKQIPKKPIEMEPTDKLLNGYYACPVCHGWVGMDEYSNKYCGCCGQKIDWSDKV